MEQIDISDIEPPPLIRENSGFSFLLPRADWLLYHQMLVSLWAFLCGQVMEFDRFDYMDVMGLYIVHHALPPKFFFEICNVDT
jgi:hypothetical protein